MDKINCLLEMELGITGGEEDGVNNEDVAMEKLYSQPEEVDRVYTALSKVSKNFTIAASFGNVHGVYKPGNVKLSPAFLGKHQAFIKEKHNTEDDLPALLVFHGGSGSSKAEILEAIGHGVIKMNIDTDTRTFGLCCGRYLTVRNGCEAFWAWREGGVASGSVRTCMLLLGADRIHGTNSAGGSASDLFSFPLSCCLFLVSEYLVGCLRLSSFCLHLSAYHSISTSQSGPIGRVSRTSTSRRRLTCSRRLATRTARTSPTRRTMTRACGFARPSSRSSSAWQRRLRTSTAPTSTKAFCMWGTTLLVISS